MLVATIFMNLINENLNIFYWRELIDTVPQIKYMSPHANRTESINHSTHLTTNGLFIAKQR